MNELIFMSCPRWYEDGETSYLRTPKIKVLDRTSPSIGGKDDFKVIEGISQFVRKNIRTSDDIDVLIKYISSFSDILMEGYLVLIGDNNIKFGKKFKKKLSPLSLVRQLTSTDRDNVFSINDDLMSDIFSKSIQSPHKFGDRFIPMLKLKLNRELELFRIEKYQKTYTKVVFIINFAILINYLENEKI